MSRHVIQFSTGVLRDRTDGVTRPLILAAFRKRIDQQPSLFDVDDWGACSCFAAEVS